MTLLFRKSQYFDKTANSHPELKEKLASFLKLKGLDFSAPFGSSDTMFIAAGPLGKAVPGLKHAHLSRDISVIYRIHGKDPRLCDLYGLFSHRDLGTGTPANAKKQKNMASSFSNTKFG
jgi:hypothetical protein